MRNVITLSLALCHVTTMALPSGGGGGTPTISSATSTAGILPLQDKVLILDVDNTLYSELQARSRGLGIEEQIIANTHKFCHEVLNMTKEEADALHYEYGSTIEGLRQNAIASNDTSPAEVKQLLIDYYDQVWSNLDYSSILANDASLVTTKEDTGYNHFAPSVSLFNFLRTCPVPIYLASNSPSWHVRKIKEALGLCQLFPDTVTTTVTTPDTVLSKVAVATETGESDISLFLPTKASPEIFYDNIKREHPIQTLVLLDDSKINIEKACWHGIEGIEVQNGQVEEAIGRAIGHIDREFVLSVPDYLKAKNEVDAKSIDPATWKKLADEIEIEEDGVLRITDLGSGLLLMLEMIINGKEDKPPLIKLVNGVEKVEYHAYESNLELFQSCLDKLYELGFAKTPRNEPRKGDTYVFRNVERDIVLHLHWYDYQKEEKGRGEDAPHAIIGCCFADLMEPGALVRSLKFLTERRKTKTSPLVYFPITFGGTTQFLPSRPFCKSSRGWIPSDTCAFRSYSKCLSDDHGHNLDPNLLVDAFERHGGEVLQQGRSDWIIDKEVNSDFWDAMLYFFGTVAAPKLMEQGWDSVGWIGRSRNVPGSIRVKNVDLLFRLEAKASDAPIQNHQETDAIEVEEIQFTAPYFVETLKKSINVVTDLSPEQVMIESVCSLISSGTELKIYKGDFDDATLDVNIAGMSEERMVYPLSYGYSSVGRITHVGSAVDHGLVGKLVFSFSPHATHVVASKDAIHLVPDGIAPEDAIFMPSIETALSLVHDAHVRFGEKVAVYGQGLIGLLVTSILAMQKSPLDSSPGGCDFGTITTLDSIPMRLAMSAVMGSSQALLPDEVQNAGPFDVSIEVSGNERALQSAIDHTRNGGRIIIGSWYGNSDVKLKLGIDFHRSHKTITSSQVSEIRGELTALWSKERRFNLTWELVKLLRPSRLLTKTTSLDSADEAYQSLDKGNDIAVAFMYHKK